MMMGMAKHRDSTTGRWLPISDKDRKAGRQFQIAREAEWRRFTTFTIRLMLFNYISEGNEGKCAACQKLIDPTERNAFHIDHIDHTSRKFFLSRDAVLFRQVVEI